MGLLQAAGLTVCGPPRWARGRPHSTLRPSGVPMHPHNFDHETLDAYQLLAQVARWYLTARFPRGSAKLKVHGVDAAQSAALNTAEGRGRAGQARRNHRTVPRLRLGLSPHRAAPDVPRSRWHRQRRHALLSTWWTCLVGPSSSKSCAGLEPC